MAWKYILFDLDGTLTDPSVGILSSLRYALEAVGEEVPDQSVLLQFIGPPLMDSFRDIMGFDREETVEVAARYHERQSVIGLFENEPYEGISLALSRLKSQGKVLALATSKLESYAVRILQYFHLMKYFDVTVGSLADGQRSQKEEVIQEVFRRLRIDEDEKNSVIMVGDRKHDIEGAKKCGIASMGVCYGFGDEAELTEVGADFVVKDVGEMMVLLADDDSVEDAGESKESKPKESADQLALEEMKELLGAEEDGIKEILKPEDTDEEKNEEDLSPEESEEEGIEEILRMVESGQEDENISNAEYSEEERFEAGSNPEEQGTDTFEDLQETEETAIDRLIAASQEADDEHSGEASEQKAQKLSELAYHRIDFEEAGKKLQSFFERIRVAQSAEEQFAVHQEYYLLKDHIDTMSSLASFRHAANTTDEFYDRENDYYDEKLPVFENQMMAYQNALLRSPFRKELEEIIGPVAFRNMELRIKSVHPKLVPLQQEENRLVSEYDKLLASAKFEWDGEVLSMAGLGRYLTDIDRKVRRKAWKMLQDFMESHEEAWDDIYDKLVKNRHEQALEMGYSNYVTLGYYRMRRNCYGREEVKSFRKQVKRDLVPFVARLQELRRKRLDVDKLQLYDNGLYFKEGNPVPEGTPQQIMENGRRMYSEMSPETAEFIQKMMEQEMFDVLGRPGKRQGGFMDFLPEMGMPLVFANFNGTCGDIDVITHECGHAFQGYLAAADEIREHRDITMETAEVHSMSMEFFADPRMELFFGDDAARYCQMQLEDALCFIPYGCMVDEFQEIIYEYPQLSKQERHEVWKRLEKQYRSHLHFDGLPFFEKGGWWQRQPHIYSSPFYYIDYCLAQVCALQYKILMERDYQAAWQSYLKLCRLSAGGFFTDMLREVGLLNPFQDGFIKKLVHQLEKLI